MPDTPQLQRFLDESLDEEATDVEHLLVRRTSSAARISAGNLSRRSFGELLAELYRWRSDGALILRRGEVKKAVFFREGRPIFVKSNLVSECLGRVLIREKLISEADCEESLRRLKESNRPQGTVLIEMGAISPHNLVYALQTQLQTKLFEVFGWSDGHYQFDSRAKLPSEPVELGLTSAAVIYEGVRRAYGEERVARELGDVHKAYPVPSPDPLYRYQEIGLEPEEASLLAEVDGGRTVAELAIASPLGAAPTLRFLLAMRLAQVLEFHETASHEPLPEAVRASLRARPAAELGRPPAKPPAPPPDAWREKPGPPVATPRPPPRLPPLVDARREAELLRIKSAALLGKTHFEVLGVTESTDGPTLRSAYLALAREYHPDKHFSSASAEVRELAAEIYSRVTAAYEVLADPEERERYLNALRSPRGGDRADAISNILAAEGRFERGKALLAERRSSEAIALFREAIGFYPSEGEFHAWLGWALFQHSPQGTHEVQEALEALEEAIVQSPGLERAYLFLGHIHKAQGRVDRAERSFEKALRSNPDSGEALRELRLLAKR